MKDEGKTREQLVDEMIGMRQRISELEAQHEQYRELFCRVETKSRALLEAIPYMIFRLSRDGTFLDFIPAKGMAPSLPPDEFLGKKTTDMREAHIFRESMKYREKAFETGDTQVFECRFPSPLHDGGLRDFEVRFSVSGEDEVLAVVRDITEQKQAQEALRKSENEKKVVLDSMSELVLYYNTEMEIIWANKAAGESVGLPPDQLIGKRCHELWQRSKELCPDCPVKKALETGEAQLTEKTTPDGRSWFVKGSPIRDENGSIIGAVEVVLEITESKRTQASYRSVVENSLQGLTIIQGLRFVFANPAFCKITGYTLDELKSLSAEQVMAMVHPDDADFVRKTAEAKMRGESTPERFEFRAFRRDGETRWIEISVALINYHGGLAVQAAYIDITERKQAEDALRQSQRELTIRNEIANVFLTFSGEEVFPKALKVLIEAMHSEGGVLSYIDEHGDLVCPCTISNSYDPPQYGDGGVVLPFERWHGVWRQAILEKKSIYSNEAIDVYEGHLPIRRAMDVPIIYQGQVIGNILIVNKPTDYGESDKILLETIADRMAPVLYSRLQKDKHEKALADEKERLAVTLRSIGDGVIATDADGKVVLISKVAEELTGWTEEEAVGEPLSEIFHATNEETGEKCADPVSKILETHGTVNGGICAILLARDGTERIISSSGSPILDAGGRIIGVVMAFRDITGTRKMETEILKAQKLESIGILAGGIAHDFNNILTGILGNISLARMYEEPDKVADRLADAERASFRAKDLTQQLLTFSRGGKPIKKIASVAEVLRESTVFALSGSNVTCEFAIPEDLWQAEIDEGQIGQVINNLVVNADQAMPKGGTIRVIAENVNLNTKHGIPLEDGEYVKISIQDQGIGIAEKHLPRIFDPYFTTKQKGSGLGLATSYSIVKNHEGHIAVESQIGEGTTFYIYLPASQEKAQTNTEEFLELAVTGRERVLIMDDEEIVREVAADILGKMGYEVDVCADGFEAIELYEKSLESGSPFDVVLMDLTVPGSMGGKEAIGRLIEIDPEVKAVASSGYSNDPVMSDFEDYGFTDVIAKPYRARDLGEILHKIITEKN